MLIDRSIEKIFQDVLDECGKPNWDGEDALPVTPKTVKLAKKILSELPSPEDPIEPNGKVKPCINATCRGKIIFHWWKTQRDFSMVVSEDGDLNCALTRSVDEPWEHWNAKYTPDAIKIISEVLEQL